MLRSDTATLSSHISFGSYVKKKLHLNTDREMDGHGDSYILPKTFVIRKGYKKVLLLLQTICDFTSI